METSSVKAPWIFGIGSAFGMLAGGVIGNMIDFLMTGIVSGLLVWLIIYVTFGLTIVPEKEAWIIERFGKFMYVINPGINLLCLPGAIDKIRSKISLKSQRVDLYQDEPGNVMDFTDGSAAVKAQVWYAVTCPEKYFYEVSNPKNWIEEKLDNFMRPELQEHGIDEALRRKNCIADKALNGLKDEIENTIGVKMDRVLITDLVLPDEVVKMREERLAGQTEAEKSTRIGKGYADSINAIIQGAKDAGHEITFEQAQAIYERQRGLETVGKTGANITFIAPDIDGVMKTINIGTKK
jgi:regulator of protease activity HflC (stomatin/prohibitin superfamily)